jgi:hypothetical protein
MIEQQMQDQIEGGLIREESLYKEIMNYTLDVLFDRIIQLKYKISQLNEHGLGDSDCEKEKFFCSQELTTIRNIINNLKIESTEKYSSVIVHPHPIVEMKLTNDLITITNLETNEIESDFYLDEIIAQEIIDLMNNYLYLCRKNKLWI